MPTRSILVLDDDAAVGQTIQWIAESLGFTADFVIRPDEFFERLDRTCPDIITIDLIMPELDGVEIMRLLAERKCHSKIVISSGMGTRVLDAAQRSATEHGLSIAGVISKPISREGLRALVGEGSELDRYRQSIPPRNRKNSKFTSRISSTPSTATSLSSPISPRSNASPAPWPALRRSSVGSIPAEN